MKRRLLIVVVAASVIGILCAIWPFTKYTQGPSSTESHSSLGDKASTSLAAASQPASGGILVASAGASLPHLTENLASSEGQWLRTPLRELYAKALANGSTRDKVIAAKHYFACLEVAEMVKANNESKIQDGAWSSVLKSEASKNEALHAMGTLSAYCDSYTGGDFLTETKSRGQRLDLAYFSLTMVGRPYQERLPQLINALSSPASNPFEFTLWADADLHEILQTRYGLNREQAGYVEGIIVQKYIGDKDVLDFYSTYKCGVRLNCPSSVPSDPAEKASADQAAGAISMLLNQQRWQELVYINPK